MDIKTLQSCLYTLEDRLKALEVPNIKTELETYTAMVEACQIRAKKQEAHRNETRLNNAMQTIISLVRAVPKDYQYQDPIDLLESIRKSPEFTSSGEVFDMRRSAEMESYREKFGHNPAFIIVVGYDPAVHKRYTGEGVFHNGKLHLEGKNINRRCIDSYILSPHILDELYEISLQDRAILLDVQGKIIGTNVHLNPMDDDEFAGAQDFRIEAEPINERIGLIAGGAERQKNSYLTAKNMKGTAIYTLGENGIIRRYNGMGLTFSTHSGEDDNAKFNLSLQ